MSKTVNTWIKRIEHWLFADLFRNDSVILNWCELKRCELILMLGMLLNGLCLLWKLIILAVPQLWQFSNLSLLKLQVSLNAVYFLILPILIGLCRHYRHNKNAEKVLPYVATLLFVMMLWRDAYIIGIFSPVTAVLTVSFIAIGLVLLNINVLMFNIFLSSIAFLMSATLTYFNILPYAPVFNFTESVPYENLFWIYSMLGLLFPVFSVCLGLMYLMLQQWREREAHYRRLSQIDSLTQVLNRRSINDLFEKMMQEQRRDEYALVLLDLDFFKHINDTYGHLTGDVVLKEISYTLKNTIRQQDIVGRYGGEEFILILKNCSQQEALDIVERCRQAILALEIQSYDGAMLEVTASFGVASYRTPNNIYEAIHQADDALYRAKAAGRNQIKLAKTASVLALPAH